MTITKYRSFEEAEKSLWRFETNDSYFKELRRLFELSGKLNPPAYPHGIFKYKDLDSANRQKAEWDMQIALKRQEKKRLGEERLGEG